MVSSAYVLTCTDEEKRAFVQQERKITKHEPFQDMFGFFSETKGTSHICFVEHCALGGKGHETPVN